MVDQEYVRYLTRRPIECRLPQLSGADVGGVEQLLSWMVFTARPRSRAMTRARVHVASSGRPGRTVEASSKTGRHRDRPGAWQGPRQVRPAGAVPRWL